MAMAVLRFLLLVTILCLLALFNLASAAAAAKQVVEDGTTALMEFKRKVGDVDVHLSFFSIYIYIFYILGALGFQ
jgi:hypothetical protein